MDSDYSSVVILAVSWNLYGFSDVIDEFLNKSKDLKDKTHTVRLYTIPTHQCFINLT